MMVFLLSLLFWGNYILMYFKNKIYVLIEQR